MYSKTLILGLALATMGFAAPQMDDSSILSDATTTDMPTSTLSGDNTQPTAPFPMSGGPDSDMPQPATDIFWATGLTRGHAQPTGRKHLFSDDTLEKMYKKWCGVCPDGQVCFPPSSVVRREALECMVNKPVGDPRACPQAKGRCGAPESQGPGAHNGTWPSRIPGAPEPTGRLPTHIFPMKPVENRVNPAADPSSATSTGSDPTITDPPTSEPSDA